MNDRSIERANERGILSSAHKAFAHNSFGKFNFARILLNVCSGG
jgi:hypothetical protein